MAAELGRQGLSFIGEDGRSESSKRPSRHATSQSCTLTEGEGVCFPKADKPRPPVWPQTATCLLHVSVEHVPSWLLVLRFAVNKHHKRQVTATGGASTLNRLPQGHSGPGLRPEKVGCSRGAASVSSLPPLPAHPGGRVSPGQLVVPTAGPRGGRMGDRQAALPTALLVWPPREATPLTNVALYFTATGAAFHVTQDGHLESF